MSIDPCAQDGQLMGPCSLFLGAETATWATAQFVEAAQFARQHGISTLIIKCAEVTSKYGDIWYGGMAGVDPIVQAVLAQGVRVLTYQFLWGNRYGALATEISVAEQFLSKYGKHCLDIEGSTWAGANGQTWASQMNATLVKAPGKLFVSCPADPVRNDQLGFLQTLSPSINIYMPMVYSSALDAIWQGDYKQVNSQACLQPTLDLSQEFGANDPVAVAEHFRSAGCHAMSIWEYGFATQTPSLLDQVVAAFTEKHQGGNVMTNAQRCVLNLIAGSQFEANETEYACGFFAAALLKYATPPNQRNTNSWESIDSQADTWYADVHKSYGPDQRNGISIDQLHTIIKESGNHYWDIGAISPGSSQSSDLAELKAALSAGYPVIATVVEASVSDLTGDIAQGNPYEWNPVCNSQSCPTHVIIWVGIASDGNLLAWDYANVVGPLQGNNKVRPQPRTYDIRSIDNHFATVVQVVGPNAANPWLRQIPSSDPTTWPHGFNGQNF